MRLQAILPALIGSVFIAEAAHAQLSTPSHWRWVTDEPAQLVTDATLPDSAWRFVAMPPGWHVTTGPGAWLFDPAYDAEGRFSVETRIFLFPNPTEEGYGLFLGGHDIESERRAAVVFLVRGDGAASVVRVDNRGSKVLMPWRQHDAVKAHEGTGTAENVLRVSAEPERVVYLVNGDTMAVLPRTEAPMEGSFGLRVGRGLNVHVSNLDFTQHLALPPRQQ